MESLGLSLVVMILVMSFVWLWAVRIDNYGIVDAAWSLSFGLLALLYGIFERGYSPRKILITSMVVVWSARLGLFLTRRIWSHHPTEDGRYQEFRKSYGSHVKLGFFRFFQWQGLSVVILAVPFLLASSNADAEISWIELCGVAVWALGLIGESISDFQMSTFKKNPANRGRTCQVGLWHYSRHPNYFFESLIWWGFYLFALGSPQGWLTIYCPLGILFLLLKVTGVPQAEAQALKTRGDEYIRYQKKTSVFIPWFPSTAD